MQITKDFIAGRYEAGNENSKVVVKKNKPVYNSVYWGKSMTDLTGGAVELSKNFINDKTYKGKVTSTLVYGVQWDAILKFFYDENYLKDSTGKGNYSGSLINTGSNENYKVKNIYDMAGNVGEWTMEAYSTSAVVWRGGDYRNSSNDFPVSNRFASTPSPGCYYIGFRIALYF